MNSEEKFTKLNSLLEKTRRWWQFGAFHSLESRWQKTEINLHRRLEVARLGYDDFCSSQLEPLKQDLLNFIPELKELEELIDLVRVEKRVSAPSSHWQYKIAGRKWSQISLFAGHIPDCQHLLEWCAGKGHLGRLAATRDAKSLTSIEWQHALCDSNRRLSQRLNIDQHYCSTSVVEQDVLSSEPMSEYTERHFAIALHACGDLHTHLVRVLVKNQGQGLCLSPCCYNLIRTATYQPLSTQATTSSLKLSKLDLSLPLRTVVTAGARGRREQQQEKLWRIAFDNWQRSILNSEEYLPLSTIPKHILKGSFEGFIKWAAEKKQNSQLLENSIEVDSAFWIESAKQRLVSITQMEWVQSHFQRAIEVWLMLDQVLFLEHNAYDCELFEFCGTQTTPRNLMLKAIRKSVGIRPISECVN